MKHQIVVAELELKPANDRMRDDVRRLFESVLAQDQYVITHYTEGEVLAAMQLARAICEASDNAAKPHYTDLLGKTTEEIQMLVDAKTKRYNHSAGARALSRKYGKESAEQIIERVTGKKVSLQR